MQYVNDKIALCEAAAPGLQPKWPRSSGWAQERLALGLPAPPSSVASGTYPCAYASVGYTLNTHEMQYVRDMCLHSSFGL